MSRALLLMVGLTALGLALRLVALDAESAWTDEMYSLHMARAPLEDLLSGASRDRGNPSGYYLVLHAWLRLFGDDVPTARALSAFGGALAVPLTALLARRLGLASTVALAAAAIVAVSPPLVYLGREARAFALVSSLVVVHLLCALSARSTNRWRSWLAYGASAAALLYLHYFSAFVVLALGLWLVSAVWPSPAARVRLAVAAAVAVALFAPYLGTLAWQLGGDVVHNDSSWKHAAFWPAFALVGHTLTWIDEGAAWVVATWALAVALVWLPVGWLVARDRASRIALAPVLAVGFGAPLLGAAFVLVTPLFNGRYAAICLPAAAIVIACALASAQADADRAPRARLVARVAALALSGLVVASLVRLYGGGFKDDWRAVARALGPSPVVYALPAEAARALRFYRPEVRVDVLDPKTLTAEALRLRLRADGGIAWLVVHAADPRVAEAPERALAALPSEVVRARVIDRRRLRVVRLALDAP